MPPLLSMHGVSKRFGATLALKDVSLEVHAGEVLALIGENGAGKSTLMKVLSGAHRPDAGKMELAGKPYAPPNPHQGRVAGVAMIYQELNLAADLSIEDNLLLGQEQHRWGFLDRQSQRRRVRSVLEQLGHPNLRPETPVRELSVGAQQVVEIARALMSDAKVIVFDEPTSSLTQADAQRLFEVIKRLRQSGIGIIYISHFLEEIRHLCSRYTVLRDGEVAGSGNLEGVTEKQIVTLMVGRNVEDLFPQVPHQPGAEILALKNLSGLRFPIDVNLTVHRGEILGIAGLVGAGRTELLRCLFALDPVRSGQVRVHTSFPKATPSARIQAGMGLVSEDRKGEGLAQACSINDNLTNSRLTPYSRWGFLNLRRRRAAASDWMRKLQIKARDPEQPVQTLSGGNQQKVAIARVMHQQADIFLLDEPTRGIDVGTKAEIYRLMGELAANGKTILFVSSYVTELLAVCDRVGVMARGRLREVKAAKDWTEEAVLSCAISGGEN
ncbi:MAG: sugar ABC transporter ATP-binding protein [Planctomycetota bacterium]